MMVGSSMDGVVLLLSDDETESVGGVGVGAGISCSICLELVVGDGDRSIAKLLCGHDFHLDCIGSAFNVKGEMQCPNCRQIEKGRWLYSSGSSRIFPEFNADEWRSEWNPDDEPYDIAFPELPFSVHWCPYGGVPRVRSSMEEVESSSATYHDQQGHHTIFAEHTGGSSVAPSYVTYMGQPPSPSLNSNDGVDIDRFTESQLLSALPRSHMHDITPVHVFSSVDTLRFGETQLGFSLSSRNFVNDQPSNQPPTVAPTRGDSDSMTRTRTHAHPLLPAHRSDPRVGSSFAPPTIPHHPRRIIRSHERIQAPRVIHHHPQQPNTTSPGISSFALPDVWRYNGRLPSGAPPLAAVSSHSDHNGGFFVFPPPPNLSGRNLNDSDNHVPVHTHIWERDYISHFPGASLDRDSSGWGSNHQSTHGSDTSTVWPRHWS